MILEPRSPELNFLADGGKMGALGTGLGLSEAFGFSKQSGGEIAVTSLPGQGATFTIHLPCVQPKPPQTHAHPAIERASAPSDPCILVVDDNKDVGEFSTETLPDLGYKTRWVASGDEALAVLAEDDLA